MLLRYAPLFALCLHLLLFPATGFAKAPPEMPIHNITAKDLAQEIDPSGWHLSPEAKHLYYYLLLSEGMSSNSQALIDASLKGLLQFDPSLPVFQDGATIMMARGEFKAAESITLQGLKKFPDDPLLSLILSGVYSETGQTPRAISLLEEHMQKKPGSVEIMEELVRLYLNEGMDKKASDILSKMPEKSRSVESELFRARVLSSVGRNAEAKKGLQRLIETDPKLFEAWVELGFIAEREKDNEEAIKAYQKALELVPDNPEIYFRIAVMQIQSKMPTEAVETLEKADASPGIYIQSALRFANGKYYTEANLMLDKARAAGANPDEIALFRSMFIQESAKNPLDALPPLDSIPATSKLYPSALLQKVRVYIQAKEYTQAYEMAKESRELFPDRKEIWGLEAYALVKLQEGPGAEKLLREALERYPDDEQLMFSLGVVQDESDKKDDAMRTMEKIIALNPKHFQALNYIGYTLAEKNLELERAHALITTALEESPDADYIVDSLAWVEYRMGKLEDAWKTINRCIELGGDDATIWEHYGDIARSLKKLEEAAKGYTEALLREPDNVKELRQKLTDLQNK